MGFLHIVHYGLLYHPLPTTVVSPAKQMFVGWTVGKRILVIIILPAIVGAVFQLLVGFIIRSIKMRATRTEVPKVIKVICNDDQ